MKSISLGKVFSTCSNETKTASIPAIAAATVALNVVSTVVNASLHVFNVASAAVKAPINASVTYPLVSLAPNSTLIPITSSLAEFKLFNALT